MKRYACLLAFCVALFSSKICFSDQSLPLNCILSNYRTMGVTEPHFGFYPDQQRKNVYVFACQSTKNPDGMVIIPYYCEYVFSFVINNNTVRYRRVGNEFAWVIIPETSNKMVAITPLCTSSPSTHM
jgi:hypothetical protein